MSCSPFGNILIEDITAEITDCYLIFYTDEKIIKSLPLCGAAISCSGSDINICTSMGAINISVSQLEELGITTDLLNSSILSCKNGNTVEALKFGSPVVRYCDKETGEICELTKYLQEIEGGGLEIRYQIEGDANWYDLDTILIDYEPYKEAGLEVEECVLYENEDKKLSIPIDAILEFSKKTGKETYYLKSDYDLGDKSNPIDIKNYKKMSNSVGLPQEVEIKCTPEINFEYCPDGGLTGTLQDIFNFALLNPNFFLPDGTTRPDGILSYEIDAEFKGNTCAGKVTTGQGFTFGDPATASGVSFDGGQGTCGKIQPIDADCDNLQDQCYDLTTPVVIPDGHGVVVKLKGVLCDDDPTTQATK